ncbi:extensin-like [Austrofundulus limnaeus]|uniref:Extensin-like n=1 Tax=Austrofundulus limnaeus TaxID=52670 RepID=A0A2I4C6I8_AUSLI|nr:PREDICTED: extensin-like [Austrofundulus limnaeus]
MPKHPAPDIESHQHTGEQRHTPPEGSPGHLPTPYRGQAISEPRRQAHSFWGVEEQTAKAQPGLHQASRSAPRHSEATPLTTPTHRQWPSAHPPADHQPDHGSHPSQRANHGNQGPQSESPNNPREDRPPAKALGTPPGSRVHPHQTTDRQAGRAQGHGQNRAHGTTREGDHQSIHPRAIQTPKIRRPVPQPACDQQRPLNPSKESSAESAHPAAGSARRHPEQAPPPLRDQPATPAQDPSRHQRPSTHPSPQRKYYTHPNIRTTLRTHGTLDTQAGSTHPVHGSPAPHPATTIPRPTSPPKAPSPEPGTRAQTGPQPGNRLPGLKPPRPHQDHRPGVVRPQDPKPPMPTPAQLNHRIGDP